MEKLKILLVTMLPLLAGACRSIGGQEIIDTPTPADTLQVKSFTTTLTALAPYPVLWTDVLVYRTDGLKDLEAHLRSDGPTVQLSTADSLPKKVAVVANAGGSFNTGALNHFDSLDGIVLRLADENPSAPVMSGIFDILPGHDTTLTLTPLLCTVELISVTNWFIEDKLAENPRVWLENVNTEAELFRTQGFTVRDAARSKTVYLPFDIGIYTQYPQTRLFCYPNDLPNPDAGNPATELVLQCEIEGETWTGRFTLHPIMRGETIQLEAEIRPYGAGRH